MCVCFNITALLSHVLCVCVCVNLTALLSHVVCVSGSQEESQDQAKLIVGVVAGLLIAAAVVGLIYWLYMKNSRYTHLLSLLHTHAFAFYI